MKPSSKTQTSAVTGKPKAPVKPGPVRKAKFEIFAPEATNVFLAGTFNGWKLETELLKKSKEGKWSLEIPLAKGAHEYLFQVDGVWMPDPESSNSVPNPFGGHNSVVEI